MILACGSQGRRGCDPRGRGDRVAAFIGEPIQGAGASNFPPASYWPEIQRICRQYDVLLMLDEVITGYGRTGNGSRSDARHRSRHHHHCQGADVWLSAAVALLVGDRIAATLVEKGGEFTTATPIPGIR